MIRNARFAAVLLTAIALSAGNAPAAPAETAPAASGGSLELSPLFASCGYAWRGPATPDLAVRYRRAGQAWHAALPPVRIEADGMYRGSLLELA